MSAIFVPRRISQQLDVSFGTVANDDFLQRKSGAWSNRTVAQVKTDLSLNNVENTALSTWAGSTNITTLGTVTTGAFNGTIGAATPNTGAFTTGSFSGAVTMTAGTASSSSTTGALVVTGGVGISGSLYVGTLIQSGTAIRSGDYVLCAATSWYYFSGRGGFSALADGVIKLGNNADTAGTVLDISTNGTIKLRDRTNAADATVTTGAITASGAITANANGAASAPAVNITGVPFAGTGTTSFPLVYINETGATASTVLNTAGTLFGVNGNGTADMMNLLKDGVSIFKVASDGAVVTPTSITSPLYYGSSGSNGILRLDGNTSARGLGISSLNIIAWSSGTFSGGVIDAVGDTFIGRQAAANIRQGAADAASPVSQTFSVQNVSTGTSNTAGADRYYDASQGTGTGAGGSHIFRTAPAGGAGSSQNALAAALTISSVGNITASGSFTSTNGGFIAASGSAFSWSSRAQMRSLADGTVRISDASISNGATLDVTTDGTIKLRDRTNAADATVTAGKATLSGPLITTPQALSGAGAINLTTGTTAFTSTGAAQALTLADGTNGQIKTIVHVADGGSGVLTPTTASGYTIITFANVGDSVTLQFFTTAGWCIVGIFGAVAA